MGIEVFNRHESKFFITPNQFEALQKRLSDFMELDAYNQGNHYYSISNIYYDTWDDTLITKSIAKPQYKEKLRLRAYGVPSYEDKVYLEIKKKGKRPC